jgi:tetratricopeptide (TPR) repeat protein
MADRDQEDRIRDLTSRVEREPRSRFFVPLAEELRKAGRLPETIRVLEEGLALHPSYVAARVALARAFLEAGRIDESMATFSKVLQDDPSNLVAAKALGDIHLSRGESTEALKRYLRFRAVSGDRRLDDVIAKLREEIGPSPEALSAPALPPPAFAAPAPLAGAPPPAVAPVVASPLPPIELWPSAPTRRETDPFDITSVPYSPPPALGSEAPDPGEEMPSRDLRLDAVPFSEPPGETSPRPSAIRLPESAWPFGEDAGASPPAADVRSPAEAEPAGRTLAELYLEQGHYAEAIRVARQNLAASPADDVWKRLLAEAEERLAAGQAPDAPPPPVPDRNRERRLAKIAILNQWLDTLEARSRP